MQQLDSSALRRLPAAGAPERAHCIGKVEATQRCALQGPPCGVRSVSAGPCPLCLHAPASGLISSLHGCIAEAPISFRPSVGETCTRGDVAAVRPKNAVVPRYAFGISTVGAKVW